MSSYYRMHLDETLRKPIYDGQVPDLGFLNYVSTTAQVGWNVGDSVVLPDGREFRHCKSLGSNTLLPTLGCNFTDTGYTAYTAFAVAASVGDREITIPAATHTALTADQLKGGYVIVFNGSGTNDVTYGIAGNDAAAANALFKIRLDQPLAVAIVASTSACETYQNPWGLMDCGNTVVLPRAGAPVVSVSAAANYFWLQTKGPKFVAPQATVGNNNGGMQAYWRHDGSADSTETALAVTVNTYLTDVPAGTVISGSAGGNGPLISLLGAL